MRAAEWCASSASAGEAIPGKARQARHAPRQSAMKRCTNRFVRWGIFAVQRASSSEKRSAFAQMIARKCGDEEANQDEA